MPLLLVAAFLACFLQGTAEGQLRECVLERNLQNCPSLVENQAPVASCDADACYNYCNGLFVGCCPKFSLTCSANCPLNIGPVVITAGCRLSGGNPAPTPVRAPTRRPTRQPTRRPTPRPTSRFTLQPTRRPTRRPTRPPTRRPTRPPTRRPTPRPVTAPTMPVPRPPSSFNSCSIFGKSCTMSSQCCSKNCSSGKCA